MKKQRVNLAKDSKRQERKSKGGKSSLSVTEQEITQVELHLQNAPPDLQGKEKTCYYKVSLLPPEKLVAEILAIICIVLVGSVLKMVLIARIPFTVMEKQNNSFQSVKTQKACDCGHCPEEWFTYSTNCYSIGKEFKTWDESLRTCASKNSNLLYIDNEEEMLKWVLDHVHAKWCVVPQIIVGSLSWGLGWTLSSEAGVVGDCSTQHLSGGDTGS
ncbi:PREDICTED: NKG2-F type II integral membrane protein-like [Propithecus coquereli]|uniref:NKG2-F type II integral membrane protein-like n=1 Tax=Propithecus coquereli TaxID=379532 RepID=UPI00063ED84B|nr:PREDICTED: NKG2-F type II integral membrane protein-like [Propithecus coquereli]